MTCILLHYNTLQNIFKLISNHKTVQYKRSLKNLTFYHIYCWTFNVRNQSTSTYNCSFEIIFAGPLEKMTYYTLIWSFTKNKNWHFIEQCRCSRWPLHLIFHRTRCRIDDRRWHHRDPDVRLVKECDLNGLNGRI